MAIANRALIVATTGTAGTGPFTVAPVDGFRNFSVLANGTRVTITRWDAAGQFEEGEVEVNTAAGVTTLTWAGVARTDSSNSGAPVTWAAAATQNVVCGAIASQTLVKANALSEVGSTAAGLAILQAANAAAQRTALGLGSAALSASTAFEPAFASGTKWPFAQASAPTGFTKDTTNNDAALRVVSGGTGGSPGGTRGLSAATVGDHVITILQMPAHGHTLTTQISPGAQTTASRLTNSDGQGTVSTSVEGGDQPHNHSLALKYVDVILCSKN